MHGHAQTHRRWHSDNKTEAEQMNLPCRLDLVSRCGAGCTLCEMCCPCFSLWKFLQRKEQFLNVACKLLVKVLGFFCILGMDQNWKIYGTETLRNWIEGTLPLSYDLFFDLVIWRKERLKIPELFAVLQKNKH